jgi:hypothetical protein
VNSSIFWDIMPRSPLKFGRRFGGIYRLNLHCLRIGEARNQHVAGSKENNSLVESWGLSRKQEGFARRSVSSHWLSLFCYLHYSGFLLDYSSALKTEAISPSETSVDFQRTTRCYVTQNRTFHNHCSKFEIVPLLN